ncbi:Thioredoxin [Candidatus Hepatincolaceae symbiont of Richtersius coronifer]
MQNHNVSSVTDATFNNEVLEASKNELIVVDFWAPWCGPCLMMAPILDELVLEFKKLDKKIKIVKINVDENPNTSANYAIKSIPTLILFKDGKKVADMIGSHPKQSLQDFFSQHSN